MPEISIVLPVYNGEDHLADALESIVSQTFADFELIVVNDCSTDRSPEIVKSFAVSDKRVKLTNNSVNKKLPASLNVGFSLASGTYFTWTSDDNKLKPDCLACLLDALKKHDVDIVYADTEEIDESGKLLGVTRRNKPLEYLSFENIIGACFLYKKDVHHRLNGFKDNLFLIEDYDFWVRSYLNKFKFYHIEEIKYIYMHHNKSLTQQHIEKIFFYHMKYILKMKDAFKDSKVYLNILQKINKIYENFYYNDKDIEEFCESTNTHYDNDFIKQILTIINNHPFNLYNYIYLATIYTEENKFEESKKIIADVLDIFPYWAGGYNFLSYIYELNGEIAFAADAAHRAVQLDDNNSEYKTRLLSILKKRHC
ncbi:MAG: glycosyltransferase [Desulfovibrio sp.]|jgi:glycosyltransferase involved in cell wall biosynthesis|nr:glycosyltransferase [Desulfovibrio sp.]